MYNLYQVMFFSTKYPIYTLKNMSTGKFSSYFYNLSTPPRSFSSVSTNSDLVLLATVNSLSTFQEELENNYPELLI